MKKILDFLFSMQFAGTLMLVFAAAIGTATFIENDYGTTAAKMVVYNATWFEVLLLILTISLIGSVFKYKLIQRRKYATLAFHLAFVLIMAGAALTRFVGYEGNVRIREGQSSNELISLNPYVQIWANDGNQTHYFDHDYLFSAYKKNRFSKGHHVAGKHLEISFREFIPNAATTIVEDPNGIPYIAFVTVARGGGRQPAFLAYGSAYPVDTTVFNFRGTPASSGVNFRVEDGKFLMNPTFDLTLFSMMDNVTDTIMAGEDHEVQLMKLYNFGGQQVVFRNLYQAATTKMVAGSGESASSGVNAVVFDLEYDGDKSEVTVMGGKGMLGVKQHADVGGLHLDVAYGSKIVELPFSLYLRDFQLERYPGSHSPSSYASEVTLNDPRDGTSFDYRIYMNNILNYGGYRFFQSSYDKDELGTILSVNRDWWGTFVTYAGYFVLTLGLFLNFFSRRSRFQTLARASREMREMSKTAKTILIGGLIMISGTTMAQNTGNFNQQLNISKEHAARFGELIIQNKDGRMEPINTLTNEILRKVNRSESFMGLNSDQVFLGMASNPGFWQTLPMIKVSNSQLKAILGVSGNYASFNDFIDMTKGGAYKLSQVVEVAYQKKPVEQNKFDKEVIKVDERVNIVYMIYMGDFLNIFPKPNDPNHKWYQAKDADMVFDSVDAGFVRNIMSLYFSSINDAQVTGDWSKADEYLGHIKTFQARYGSHIFPSSTKRSLEITYNKVNIFKKLFPFYATTGFLLIILMFVNILSPKFRMRIPILILSGLILIGFLLHTAGLGVRWYIGGHAPWSNGYETMIFISWGIVLSGIIFAKRSRITLATTAILASLGLMVANLSWLDPEITNLVPVLKSYWLVIHVAVITSSYSFLGIGALLGFLNLLLISFRNQKNNQTLGVTIKELTNIIEMNLIIGVFLITIGTFLGAVWANESWGRYWGWDPKETWALVTVLVYSFVVHMRMIPGLKGIYTFNFVSLISFSSVLMTYFGVNYYLSGMHSYANGDPVPVPSFVYYTIAIIAIVSLVAYVRDIKNRHLPPVGTNLDPDKMDM